MKKGVSRCFYLFSVEYNGLMSMTVLLREFLATEPFKYKPRTQQRSNLWNCIVDHLNDVKDPAFSVTQRAIEDKFNLLKDKFIAKKKEQDKASGIDVEVTEIDVPLKEIIDKEKYYELECKGKDEEHERKIENSKATVAGMRQKTMESLGESLKRNLSDAEDSVSDERHKTKKDQGVRRQLNIYRPKVNKSSI